MTGSAGRQGMLFTGSANERPLPPRWDGVPVEWSAWEPDLPSSAYIHGWVCERCRCRDLRLMSKGRFEGERHHRLVAERCPRCGLDSVIEFPMVGHSIAWTLDDDDYTAEGSYPR